MFLSFSVTDIITVPFGMILDLFYRLTSNYGVAIILFSVCVNLLLHPVRMKNTLNGVKKARLQPKVKAIREMFPGKVDVQTKIMEELYAQEGVSPSMGCLTTIIPIVLLLILYGVVSQPVVNMLGISRETAYGIYDLMMERDASIFGVDGVYNELIIAANIPAFASEISVAFPEIGARALEGINFQFLGLDLAQVPELDVAKWEVTDWQHIGLILLPALSALVYILPTLIKSFVRAFIKHDKNGKTQKKEFDFLTPLLLLAFTVACFQVPAAMSLYWLTQSIMSMILKTFIDKKVRNLPPEVSDLNDLVEPYRTNNDTEIAEKT